MTITNWFSILIFISIFIASFLLTDNAELYINTLGLTIVLSGTIGAIFLSYPSSDITAALKVARNAYHNNAPTTSDVVDTLIYLSVRSKRNGVIALEDMEDETTISFLKRAISMLVDGYSADELRDVLHTEIYYFKQRRTHHERLFRHASRLAPAFGVAGSVIGLIAMLSGIGDPQTIIHTIPIALTSTLYGILLANFLFIPVAEIIYSKTEKEIMLQKLVTDAVIAIYQEQNSLRLVKKLESFITPSARHENQESLEALKERVRNMRLDEETVNNG
jgi:chemotaxis protein MotA